MYFFSFTYINLIEFVSNVYIMNKKKWKTKENVKSYNNTVLFTVISNIT